MWKTIQKSHSKKSPGCLQLKARGYKRDPRKTGMLQKNCLESEAGKEPEQGRLWQWQSDTSPSCPHQAFAASSGITRCSPRPTGTRWKLPERMRRSLETTSRVKLPVPTAESCLPCPSAGDYSSRGTGRWNRVLGPQQAQDTPRRCSWTNVSFGHWVPSLVLPHMCQITALESIGEHSHWCLFLHTHC